jgi:GH24 family phage-related lysozyme (muramidase)
MNPSLLRYALSTIKDHPGHEAFWAAVEALLAPEQQQRLEQGGDIRSTLWLAPPANPVAVALPLVMEFEGCRLSSYPDPETGGDPWTIGWGSTRHADGSPVARGDRISQVQADALLAAQLQMDCAVLMARIPCWAILTTNQRASLLSFSYNVGPYWFGNDGFGTITRCLKHGNLAGVPSALMLYVNPGGPSEAGLRRRRRAEGALWSAQ